MPDYRNSSSLSRRDVIAVGAGFAASALAANAPAATGHFEGKERATTGASTMHGDDNQLVPIANSAILSAKLLRRSTLKVYQKFSHGMCTTHADVINPDLLAYILE